MIKKYKYMLLWGFLLLVFIQKCTTINIMSNSLFKKKEYDSYPALKEGVYSEKSEILKISESSYNSISYDEKGNYFILNSGNDIIKINNLGEIVFNIERTDNISFSDLGSYIFTEEAVYDLTKKEVKQTILKKVIKASGNQLELAGFLNIIEDYYHKASIVIYANTETYGAKNYKVYFKIDNDWFGIYISKKEADNNGIKFYSKGKILTKYPEKYTKLILLKNPENNKYATWSSGDEQFSGTPDFVDVSKENKLIYPKYEGIKSHFYQKQNTHGTIVYTNIPVSFMGTIYLELKIKNEVFKFKEQGIKYVGSFLNPVHYVSYYVLPKIYTDKNSVSFLKVFYPSNAFDADNKGLYVIKPK